jgi:hypothetical protein
LRWLKGDDFAIYTIIVVVLKVVIIFSPATGRVVPHPAAVLRPGVFHHRRAALAVWVALPQEGDDGDDD